VRFERGQFILLDLNSQNGTWIDAQRVQRITLEPGRDLAIGPYVLRFTPCQTGPRPDAQGQRVAPAARRSPLPDRSAPRVETQRLMRSAAAGPPPGRRAPPAAGPPPVRPGLIAWLARQPKPVIFAGFGLIAIMVVVVGRRFAPPADETRPTVSHEEAAPSSPGIGTATNADMIAGLLEAGKALVERGEYERAIRDHFDRILLIDRSNTAALEAKARAEAALRARGSATVP
jgi:hypothetical protein